MTGRPNEISELLTINEVSQILKCSPATLRNWDRDGILKAIRIGKRRVRRYKREDIEKLVTINKDTEKVKSELSNEIDIALFAEASPIPILITDTDACIYYANPAWEKLTGYSLEEVKGENPRFLQSGKTPQTVFNALWRSLSKGQPYISREVVNKKKNGEEFQVHTTYFAIQKNGKNKYFVQTLHDITRIIELEKQKDAFIGIASHELKTPITTLYAYSQILEKRLSKIGDKKDLYILSNIMRETKRLTGLIDDLLNVTRLEAGKLAFQPEVFDINELVDQVIDDIQHTTDTHKIKKDGKIDKDVIGDMNRVEQVLINLITNAIKYSPGKNSVLVHLSNDSKHATISVEDFGFGISKRDQKNIFQRFYRTKDKDEEQITGFGLGLYISSEIVKRHKGKIWVKSTKGKGSTFSFTLPVI